ncbi:MAG: hypothetical protein KBC84_11540, partial [Proteobacteria bacterium]|nr:hypothetical protein [Pseudomonadota bacterium]
LKGVGELKDERVKLVSAPPNQIYDALHAGDKDISAINFFPYYNLNEKYNNSQIIDSGIKELNTTESVIFVHQSLTSNKILLRCLSIAIRDAWLTLAEGGSELNQTVSSIFEDKNLLRLICRFGGLINHNQI